MTPCAEKTANCTRPSGRSSANFRCDDPTVGTGKPEPLRHNLSGLWSRRLSRRDRIIYKFDDKSIYIFALGGHYDDI
jgi:Txe/YoeB family toxin of toxin-antitoxin system